MASRPYQALKGALLYLVLFILPALMAPAGDTIHRLVVSGMLRQLFLYTIPALLLCLFLINKGEHLKVLFKPAKSDGAMLVLLLLFLTICALLYRLLAVLTDTGELTISFEPSVIAWSTLVIFTLCSVLLEESFFRAWLPEQFKLAGLSPRISIVLSALLFSLAHFKQGFPGMTQALFAGLFLGWAAQKTGRLVAPIVSHSLFNMAVWIISLS